MKWQAWTFALLDTGFFRDGQPFHAGEGGYGRVQSGFPPSAATLQGAIRTALARAAGWHPEVPESWPSWLGGPDDLGSLVLRGPYLLAEEPLFPAPLHLLVSQGPAFARLVPGEPVACDLGAAIRLPRATEVGRFGGSVAEGWYLTRRGLASVLSGSVPRKEEAKHGADLWAEEPRVGLARARDTRTAKERHLYYAVHVRPRGEVRVHGYLGGIPEGWTVPLPAHVCLGGEGRVAAVEVQAVEEGAISSLLPSCPSLEPDPDGIVRFTLTLLTPGYYADPVVAVREGPPGVPGECVSACLGKLRQVGGWNLKEHGPRPLEPVIPPGSTWFYAAAPGDIDRIVALHGGCLGNKSEYGYGQVVVGRWTEMASAEPVG